jgi:ribonuclease P protein component
MGFMYKLEKKSLLRKNKNFQKVYKAGKSYANKELVIYVVPNKNEERRVGFAAGKRLGNAVKRNRVKRLLRETYRLNQHRLCNGVDLIIVGRQSLLDKKLPAVISSFLSLSKRAKIVAE